MAASNLCPTEDIIKGFIEYLVDPLLRSKASAKDIEPSQQQAVAKQMHSVVLLYNYYHRKQHSELAILSFEEFCKLALILRPTLLAHMKFMQKPDTELVDVEKQLSLTEKKIINACDICKCLDASKNVPNIEGWPISKVAVLLTDSKEEYCFLLFGFINNGVWSVIEKDVDTSCANSEVTSGTEYTYKKRRVIKKPTQNELNVEDGFLQVGYSAVQEAAGVKKTDIMLLQSYTVYSHSKEKTASRFYIMKCSQLIKQTQTFVAVPIKDLIERMQGPLVEWSYDSWTLTPVLEYLHVLPYSEKISEWISSETSSNSMQDSKLVEKNMLDIPEATESYVSCEGMSVGPNDKPNSGTIEAIEKKENKGSSTITLSGSIKEAQDMDVDNSSVFPSKIKEEGQHVANTLQVSEDQEIENPSGKHYSNRSLSPIKAEKVDSTKMLFTEGGIRDQSACDKICANTSFENDSTEECDLTAKNCYSDLEKLQTFLASKRTILSQTAHNALTRKKNHLVLQHRMIEDEIAMCEQKIQRMSAGEEDDIELKIESIIEGCNDTWVRNQGRMCQQHLEDQCLPAFGKSKRLKEAVLTLQSSCQELDYICHENNWILPTYRLSLSDGGFEANVSVKGLDFECSCGGKTCSCPRDARESAATQMLTKLRDMAKSGH